MNENINLCEILKGHEGEIFYSPLYGSLKLIKVDLENYAYPIYFRTKVVSTVNFDKQGKPNGLATECLIFPSKDQRDWNKWDKENNHKTPKTWSELIKNTPILLMGRATSDCYIYKETEFDTPIEKAASALLKIHELIEFSYGGNVSGETWHSQKDKWLIIPIYDKKLCSFTITRTPFFADKCHIAFNSKEQAKEFLSYPENVQLLKDYFMI